MAPTDGDDVLPSGDDDAHHVVRAYSTLYAVVAVEVWHDDLHTQDHGRSLTDGIAVDHDSGVTEALVLWVA